mgnify:CR=1 FL=1
MKIIITGTSGFVGRNLKTYLKDNGYSIQQISLRNNEWLNTIDDKGDALIHLAGKAHDTKNTAAPEVYYEVNTELTKKLFDFFLSSDIRDFFYFSSVKAVKDKVDVILDENTVAAPQTPYGKSKYAAEQYVREQKIPSGKRVFILRPTMIHGPGNKGNLNLLYTLVTKGIPWPLAAFENARSFLGIDNLNYIISEILRKPAIASGIYNVADDGFIATNRLIELIAESQSKAPRLWRVNSNWIAVAAKAGDKLKLPLNSERLQKLTDNYQVSNTKIKKALGIKNLPLSAEEGLKKTFESFKK